MNESDGHRARLPGPRDGNDGGRRTGNSNGGPPRRPDRRAAATREAARGKVYRRRRIFVVLAGLLVVAVACGAFIVLHLNANIRTVAIPRAILGTETTNAQGHTPINVLVMGSDTRGSAADCKIGGGCSLANSTAKGKDATSLAANADVEMLVHISADRSNASIISIPRDTVVQIPECTDPATGKSVPTHKSRINSTLQYGPACALKTVHELSGVPLDHFAVIDFAGVITMSDAVGGVNVCVDNNVYDTYSHLKLARGSHTLKGKSALEFLRTRHGFGNGGDIGRTVAQHLFLSAMLRQLESASTLANPLRLYDLANAATKAVTVDTGLGDITKLTGLAKELNGIPGKRITFTTLPTIPDPQNINEVVLASNAQAMFTKVKNDVSLSAGPTTGRSKPSTSSKSTTPSTPKRSGAPTSSGTDYATTVDKAVGCAQVSQARTVQINGIPMTPTRAYALSPQVANSAP